MRGTQYRLRNVNYAVSRSQYQTANLPLLNSKQSNTLEKHTNLRYLNLRCRRRIGTSLTAHTRSMSTTAPHKPPLPSLQTHQKPRCRQLTQHKATLTYDWPCRNDKGDLVHLTRAVPYASSLGQVSNALSVEASDWAGYRTVSIDTRPVLN